MTTTTTAVAVVRATADAARELGSGVIGQEHVILAIGDRPDSLGGRAFSALGIEPDSIRKGLLAMVGTKTGRPGAAPAPTPRLQKALEEADAEAAEQGRPTTTADLLLGILRTHQGVGYQLLGYAGVTEEKLRGALDGVIAGHPELDAVEDTAAATAI